MALMIQATLNAELRNDFWLSAYHLVISTNEVNLVISTNEVNLVISTNEVNLVISTNEVRRNLIAQQARFLADARNDRIIYFDTGTSQRDRAGINTPRQYTGSSASKKTERPFVQSTQPP
jgi:hypothetical protein